MSYQVLARKWRPRRFAELVGQEHVVRALVHALDHDRVHHAFLFTGTRGVGKTTIARIFAKSLNCERGVGSTPCGECSACRDIDAGRFVDLLEIDAASRTKVDDTRDMLDNVVYAPARGRYKVYLIDEVHMLSGHSFNALLKTLEEPPPHIKFLLATTDPQKLPVTVLSRCLQFSLKRLSDDQIRAQLERILGAEGVSFDLDSVSELARAGNGSMRDALSLLDQAIAFGGGRLDAAEVRAMLGTVDRGRVLELLTCLVRGDAGALYEKTVALCEYAPDFASVLEELAALVHRAQLGQFVPEALSNSDPIDIALAELGREAAPELLQLFYQIAITGRRDLGLAPGPRAGLEMTLLRMLAFRPLQEPSAPGAAEPGGGAAKAAAAAAPKRAGEAASTTNVAGPRPPAAVDTGTRTQPLAVPSAPATSPELDNVQWQDLLLRLELKGPLRELAHHAVLLGCEGGRLRLGLAAVHEHLRSEASQKRLLEAVGTALGAPVRITFETLDRVGATLAERLQREQAERQSDAEQAVSNDDLVRTLIDRFDARVVPNTTRATNRE
jgi:DNA polymerase-3 subunit gamma/tau